MTAHFYLAKINARIKIQKGMEKMQPNHTPRQNLRGIMTLGKSQLSGSAPQYPIHPE